MAQKDDRRIGTVIGGKWRVDSLLGTGSMAAVYAVTHRNGMQAAIKILHPSLCTDPQVCERFLGEGYLTNSVKHSGIVRVLDDGMTDDGCVFLVMDVLEGRTLEALRQDMGGRLGIEETLDIADALMDALIAVHKAGIIHRDLKPQNVFICANGDVKLLDFGVARLTETTKAKNKMSLFGMVLGTPSFMSPEQAVGARDQIDHRADVWSLGATIFTALTGETVHLGPHVQAKLLAAGTVQARSISIVKQDLPPAIAAVIDTSLRFEKEDRWQSVEAFRRALTEARNASGIGEIAPVSSIAPRLLTGKNKRLSASTMPAAHKSTPPVQRTTTLIGGIHTADVMKAAGSFPPPAKSTVPYGSDHHYTGAAAALPVAIIKAPKPIDLEAETLDEEPAHDNVSRQIEDSYPAVHTPIPRLDDTDLLMSQLSAKRGSPMVWLGSIALIMLAIGGVAFFALGGSGGSHSAEADPSSTDATANVAAAQPPTLTSANAPSTMVIGDKDVPSTQPQDAGAPPPQARPHTALAPPPSWHSHSRQSSTPPPSNPNPSTNFQRTPVNLDPPPANPPVPAAPPAPDPFSTPE